MEKALGIGGVFFRARDPESLGKWYFENLGIDRVPGDYQTSPWLQESGETVFAPFPEDTDYFGDDSQQWMINFRVRDLDAMIEQLTKAGVEVSGAESYPNGRFARLQDPEGNPIELWEPKS